MLFIDESGNVFHPSGPETLAVAGVHVPASGLRQLRQHADKARKRASRPDNELRYRTADRRSRRFFFDEARLGSLDLCICTVVTRIDDMGAFRLKHAPSDLYELLLYTLVAEVLSQVGTGSTLIHFDPSSAFASQRNFARRVESGFPGSSVLFAPDSTREKGLQTADMIAGAVRKRALWGDGEDWTSVERACGGRCRTLSEQEIRRSLVGSYDRSRGATSRVVSSGS
jgi:hypothetical protein